MKTPIIAAIVALACPPFHSPDKGETSISFHPTAGLELSKTFEMKMDMELDELTVSMGGQEMPMDGAEMRIQAEEKISVTDTYEEVRDGRHGKLRRTFHTLTGVESTSGSLAPESEKTGTSELQGETVVFVWDEDEEEYVPHLEDSQADEDLLEDLKEDMDLRGFLPETAVDEGDSWEFEASDMDRLLSMGGDLKIELDTEEEDESIGHAFDDAFENLKGTIKCTYTGDREVGGRTVAIIEIAAELTGSGESEDNTASVSTEFELEGQLGWDLEGGHFVSFELAGDIDIEIEREDEQMSLLMFMSGELAFSGAVGKE